MTTSYQSLRHILPSSSKQELPLQEVRPTQLYYLADVADSLARDVLDAMPSGSLFTADAAPSQYAETPDAYTIVAPKRPVLSPTKFSRQTAGELFTATPCAFWTPDYQGKGYLFVLGKQTITDADELEVEESLWLVRSMNAQHPPMQFCQGRLQLDVNGIDALLYASTNRSINGFSDHHALYGAPEVIEDPLLQQLLFFPKTKVQLSATQRIYSTVGFPGIPER